MLRFILPLAPAVLFALAGCDTNKTAAPEGDTVTSQKVGIEKDVASIEGDVRLAAANKRIDRLEAEVENLRTNPQTIELGLLKQRLEAVEAVAYSRNADRPEADDAAVSKPNKKAEPQPKVSRVATKAEADAFARGGN